MRFLGMRKGAGGIPAPLADVLGPDVVGLALPAGLLGLRGLRGLRGRRVHPAAAEGAVHAHGAAQQA